MIFHIPEREPRVALDCQLTAEFSRYGTATHVTLKMPLPPIDPPVLNSSNPWATTVEDLQALFDCPYTGAISTRTSLLKGFEHDDSIHRYAFFNASEHSLTQKGNGVNGGSLNTLGYSPIPLAQYLAMVARVTADSNLPREKRASKPIIISVTGSAEAVQECYRRIQAAQSSMSNPLCMEINLSCPNIPDKPPPAYSASSLAEYLTILANEESPAGGKRVPIGIKTPPYTYFDQFKTLIDALLASSVPRCPVDFITATNTLGSSLVLNDTNGAPALNSASGQGIGGMAGSPLHPLSLGNVKTIREMLDKHEQLRELDIIGVGGVSDQAGYARMRAVGAKAVAVATALGREGVDVFEKIVKGDLKN